MNKILLINNFYNFHFEIIESIIRNRRKITKDSINISNVYLNTVGNNKEFLNYIKFIFPTIKLGKIDTFDYEINITFYFNEQSIKKCNFEQNSPNRFFICHNLKHSYSTLISNVFYLTPLNKYNYIKCYSLPFSNKNRQIGKIPKYIIQGRIDNKNRNFKLLEKILKNSYEYDYEIVLLGKLKKKNQKFLENIINDNHVTIKANLNFIDYHKEFIDAYCIIPLTLKTTQPQYYTEKLTSSINYAKAYNLKTIIDKDLQSIYKMNKVEVFKGMFDIQNAFRKTLEDFYNKLKRAK
jgi:hypothetical protein